MRRLILPTLVALAAVSACAESPPAQRIPPLTVAMPSAANSLTATGTRSDGRMMTRKMDVVENLHGTSVADPYRWLEEAEASEVKSWTDDQNAQTRKVIDAISGREGIKKEAMDYLQVGYVTGPAIAKTKTGGLRYFHTKREGTANQPTLYVRDGKDGKDKILIDGSTLSEDGTTAIDWWYPSWDGDLVAWGKSESGSEESVLHIRDVATGKELGDSIDRTRHSSVAWLPDGKSFYYSRYPAPGSVPKGEEKYHSRIYLHVLGQDPKNDRLIFGEGRDKTDVPQVIVSPNGKWLAVRVHMGWDKSEVYLKDLSKPDAAFVEVAVKKSALFDPILRNDKMFIQTNDGAPRYKLYAVDYAKPDRASWKELIPEGQDVLHDVAILKDEIVTTYMKDAATRIERYTLEGKSKGAIALPGIGSGGVGGRYDVNETNVSVPS